MLAQRRRGAEKKKLRIEVRGSMAAFDVRSSLLYPRRAEMDIFILQALWRFRSPFTGSWRRACRKRDG
jgi:hypothetical protein